MTPPVNIPIPVNKLEPDAPADATLAEPRLVPATDTVQPVVALLKGYVAATVKVTAPAALVLTVATEPAISVQPVPVAVTAAPTAIACAVYSEMV